MVRITKTITNRESISIDKYLQEIGKYETPHARGGN
jgi:hypothetical protein